MKVAYLISAHNDPAHLRRLIGALQPNAEFFVHLDAKSDYAPFADIAALPRVHFVTPRIRTGWGNITQVHYQIALLRAYFETGIPCDRLCTLSGLDYPLWSNAAIDRYLEAHADRELMAGIDLTEQRPAMTEIYRIHRPFPLLRLGNEWLEQKVRIAARHLYKFLGLRRTLAFDCDGHTYRLFKGASWWCITPGLGRYLLHEVDSHPEILRFFHTCFGPDECIWQTLVFNSPYAEKALLHKGAYQSLAALTPLHYIHYHPVIRVLDESDFNTLRTSGKLFCRKTVTGRSDALLRRIDAELRG